MSPGAAGSAPNRRIDDIEVLRAIAVIFVVVQHMGGAVQSHILDRVTSWGGFAAGVDLFFVISGFVIARLLLPELQRAVDWRVALDVLKRFWIRRAFRIWPAAWLWLALILAASAVTDPSVFGSVGTNTWAAVAGVLNFANIRFSYTFERYFYGASFQYWSLSSEEQFYIVLPLIALLGRRFLAVVAIVFILLQVRYNNAIFYWEYRAGGLCYGVLLAMFSSGALWQRIEPVFLRRHAWMAALITAALLVTLVRVGSDQAGVPSRYSVLAVVATIVVWLAAYGRGYIFVPAWARPVLLWLGSRSFALYLVHVPVLLALAGITRAWETGAAQASHSLNHALVAPALALMLGLADLTYRLVERPMRDIGKRLASRPSAKRQVSPPRADRRIADIEVLRAVAIGFVLIQHAEFNLVFGARHLDAVLGWGQFWAGVDLFLVISGFLIARGLLQQFGPQPDWATAVQVLRRFWWRRAWRLWPAAWFWLGLIVVGSAIWTNPPFLGPLRANLGGALAGVLAYANLRFAAHPFTPYGASYAYWSLALEEQFYLLLPLVILFMGRALPWFLAAGILIQLPLAHGRWFTYLRSDALLWGVVLAIWSAHPSYRRFEPRWLGGSWVPRAAILAACLAALVRLAGPGNSSPAFTVGTIAVISAVLVWLASYGRGYISMGRLAQPVLLWAGSRSYVLYLSHVPIYQCAAATSRYIGVLGDPIFGNQTNLRSIALVGPMLLAAVEITHRCVEKPLRAFGRSALNKPIRPNLASQS